MSGYTTGKFQRGATLIEVLVSVVVSSVGLLGIAGLVATTARVNQGAYERTQIALAAQALIDSMHINPQGLAQGGYDGDPANVVSTDVDCGKHACNASQRARYDVARFGGTLAATAPNAKAKLHCRPNVPSIEAGAYDGVCRLEVAWAERAIAQGGDVSAQSLVWVFQP
jgi:type IV pilus assembly protein PilV